MVSNVASFSQRTNAVIRNPFAWGVALVAGLFAFDILEHILSFPIRVLLLQVLVIFAEMLHRNKRTQE